MLRVSELVSVVKFEKELEDMSMPIDQFSKLDLQTRRAELVEHLKDPSHSPQVRVDMQLELSLINARLKQLNIEESARLKRDADVRRALGREEAKANLARHGDRERSFAKAETSSKGRLPNQLTRGEYVLNHAKKVLVELTRLRQPLPHTVAFLPHLEAFVVAQKAHCKEFRQAQGRLAAESAATRDAEAPTWQETWKEGS